MRSPSTVRVDSVSKRTELILLISVLILALSLRIAYVHLVGAWDYPPAYDGIEYDLLADHLLSGQGFTLEEGRPYGFRPPGYPFFLALVYGVFGRSFPAVRLVNAFLGALTCLPIHLLAKRVWGPRAGIIAALGVAAHPLSIYFTRMIYPECLILLLLAIVLLVANRVAQSRRIGEVALLGFLSGLLVHLRPSLLVFGLAQALGIWLTHDNVRRRLVSCAILVLVIGLVVAPWSVRNTLVFDEFVLVSTNGGATLWASNNPLAEGGWTEPSPATWMGPDPPADLRGWPDLTETESDARFRTEAIGWIRGHPGEFLSLLPKKTIRAWGLNFGNEARQAGLPGAASAAYNLFLVVCLAGLALSVAQWRDLLAVYLLVASSILTTMIFYGSTRQSSVLVLPLVIFASLVCDRMISFALSRLPARLRRTGGC